MVVGDFVHGTSFLSDFLLGFLYLVPFFCSPIIPCVIESDVKSLDICLTRRYKWGFELSVVLCGLWVVGILSAYSIIFIRIKIDFSYQ